MATANETLHNEAVNYAIQLHRYSNGQVRNLIALLNRADAQLTAELDAAISRNAPQATIDHIDAVLSQVRAINAEAYRQVGLTLTAHLAEFTTYTVGKELGIIRLALPGGAQAVVNLQGVSATQVQAAAMARPFQGRLLKEWLNDLEAARAAKIRDAVRIGIANGDTTEKIVRTIRGTRANNYADGLLERPRQDLETIVRSAISHTAGYAREQVVQANADIIKASRWVSTLDNKTTQQCFPGSVCPVPLGRVHSLMHRFWQGDLIVITTASGKKLKATPNHPVLTANGWRAIQELRPQHDVIYRLIDNIGSVEEAEHVSVPATFSTLADALDDPAVADVLKERTTAADFHGDGLIGQHYVHKLRADCDLRASVEAAIGQHGADAFFKFVANPATLNCVGSGNAHFVSLNLAVVAAQFDAGTAQNGIEAGFTDTGLRDDIGRCDALLKQGNDSDLVGASGMRAAGQGRHDTCTLEGGCNAGCSDTEMAANSAGGFAGAVTPDDVVSVEREFFSGHVYNLHCEGQLYFADGFLVHNCRVRDGHTYSVEKHKPLDGGPPWGAGPGQLHFSCRSVSVPVLKSWRELGLRDAPPATRASLDGQVPAEMNYAEWLAKQPMSRVEEILGPIRARLYKKGGLKLEQFSNDKGVLYTLDELRKLDAAAFAKAGVAQ